MGFYSYLKPKTVVTIYPIQPIETLDLFFTGLDEEHALFHRGWKIWEKYASQFCGKNLFFDFFDHDLELHYAKVSVINKRLILSMFNQYEDQFDELAPSIKDKNSLFEALIHNEKIKSKFYSRHDLLGICLGYGQKNAALFQQMSSTLTSMGKLKYTLERPSPDHLRNLEKKWDALKKSFNKGLKDRISKKFLFTVGLGFRIDPSDPETTILQNRYRNLRKQLTQEYYEEDFLQKTLELIVLAD